MKFNVSTKPLVNALNLGVISQNVSKYYQKSCLAQITASRHDLTINLEADGIVSELNLKGSGDEDSVHTVFVDCLLLKQLVSTFEASVTSIEYVEGGVVLHSGNSKFTLPEMLDDGELELKAPISTLPEGCQTIDIDSNDWKFIKDHQMYAIAMSFVQPVYTNVWLSENKDVIVGDFDNGLFTHSLKNKLNNTCLIKGTIVNLINSLPEGATLVSPDGKSYLINVATDGFTYRAQFTPSYESDEGVGSYNAEIILGTMVKDESKAVKINTEKVKKALGQANLLNSGGDSRIEFSVQGGNAILHDNNIECKMPVDNQELEYSLPLATSFITAVISNLDEEIANVCPVYDGDNAIGLVFWTNNMTVALGGADEI